MTNYAEFSLFFACLSLIVFGLYVLVVATHLVRMVLGLAMFEGGINLALILAGFRNEAVAPIVTDVNIQGMMVDPIPQAMVLTAIVIGVAVQALALILIVGIYKNWGTLDRRELSKVLKGLYE
jgi:multicomponent Na+:H+ antiporter subunit C